MSERSANLLPYLALSGLTAWLWRRRKLGEPQRRALFALGAVWIGSALHFLALPILADRFFAPAYVLTLAVSCAVLAPARG